MTAQRTPPSSAHDALAAAAHIRSLRSRPHAERLRELREMLLPRIYRDGPSPDLILQLLVARLQTGKLSGVLAMQHDPRLQARHADVCFILQDQDPDFLQQVEDSLQAAITDLTRT